ncbi:hypothetical protein CROQUDRAFT_91482 [Cronartium quercuum f. sp. fusiforme G11]|uniref:Uncharacterized protein n=1 Tax=Cronartium quercuum f. sp. fusiforme G11 TaxID=708437 RepID=A0A9P6NNP7_9BASI|nr:hypothetical protein CROQUDRAFT_91482 [Cronartium quercuum f. sp. fusiforme G11]
MRKPGLDSAPKGKHPELTNGKTWKIPGAGAVALLGDWARRSCAAEHSNLSLMQQIPSPTSST